MHDDNWNFKMGIQAVYACRMCFLFSILGLWRVAARHLHCLCCHLQGLLRFNMIPHSSQSCRKRRAFLVTAGFWRHFKTKLFNKMGSWATSIMPFHFFSLSLMKTDWWGVHFVGDLIESNVNRSLPWGTPVAIFPSSLPKMRQHRDGECKDGAS